MRKEMTGFLLLLFMMQVYNQCSIFTCNSTLEEPICGRRVKNEDYTFNYSLRLCEIHNEICDVEALLSENVGSCKEFSNVPRLYPGETCIKNAECLNNRCVNEICVGLPENSECLHHSDCDLGLQCYKQKCTPFLHEGSTEQCQTSEQKDARLCDPNLACGDGKCVQLGSLPIGAFSEEMWACQSGFNFYDFPSKKFKCQEGDVLKDSETLIDCPPSGQCTYQITIDGKVTETQFRCQCGMRTKPQQVCPLGLKQLNKDFQTIVNYVKNHNPDCPFDRRFFCSKEPYHHEYFEALIAYQRYFDGEEDIFQNDDCTKVIFNNDYWTSVDIMTKRNNYMKTGLPSHGFSSYMTNNQY